MATLKQKVQAEHAGRALLENGGLPQPDAVEYGHTCIRFFWNAPKLVLVIDIDEPPDPESSPLALTGEDLDELEGEAA
jgi:hypothetical protein